MYVPLAMEDIDVLAGFLPLKVRVLGNRLEVQMVKLKRLNLLENVYIHNIVTHSSRGIRRKLLITTCMLPFMV
jgi:hypothetical protein